MGTALAHRHNSTNGDGMILIVLAHWNNIPHGDSLHGDSMILIAIAHWNDSLHGDSVIFIALAHWNNCPHGDSASSLRQQYVWRQYDFHSASSLKQQSSDRPIAPIGHIILVPSKPVFTLSSDFWEATFNNCIASGLTRPELEPTICRNSRQTR